MKTSERVLASAILLLLGVADLASGLTGRAFERAKEVDEKCRSENNVERAYFEKFIKARIDEIDPPDNYKCFVKCVMVELMALNDEGDFNVDEELQNVPPEIVEEGHRIVKTCHGTPGKDPCDKAYQVHKCYHKENPEDSEHKFNLGPFLLLDETEKLTYTSARLSDTWGCVSRI